ncbi:MAG: hypothetical protein IKY83_02430 [Proteobacteria bacterium]|nr:hypothetical protein [Pseudomonadota bacterium]
MHAFQSVVSDDGSLKCTACIDGADVAVVEVSFGEIQADMEQAAGKLSEGLMPAYEKAEETGKAPSVKVALVRGGKETDYVFEMAGDSLVSTEPIEF